MVAYADGGVADPTAEAVSVPLARGLVAATLERAGVTPQIVDDVTVALTEACTNAYQHVDAGDTYEVRISLDDEQFAMDVVDRGPGFHKLPTTQSATPALDEEAGRGLHLIRALTDSVSFGGDHEAPGLAVHMRKKVRWRDQSPWLVNTIGDATAKPNHGRPGGEA